MTFDTLGNTILTVANLTDCEHEQEAHIKHHN